MPGLTRLNRVDDVFNFQREVDRIFNQFWSDLPSQTAQSSSAAFHVNATSDGWRIDVPLPGVDPKDVHLDVAGSTLSIRAEASGEDKDDSLAAVLKMLGAEVRPVRWHATTRAAKYGNVSEKFESARANRPATPVNGGSTSSRGPAVQRYPRCRLAA